MKKLTLLLGLLFISVLISQNCSGQQLSEEALESAPYFFKKQFIEKTYHPEHIQKIPGHYSRNDWQAIIDSTWGEGLPTDEKLAIFDKFWLHIDQKFACFQDLIVDWDSLKTVFRTEIEDTVSRGRFAAIMNHLAMALKESHTNCEDRLVCQFTDSEPGVPLLWIGGWGDNGHFGAGLTPLEDSTLLVYKAIENHPLGIVPGDIVIGYDGVPWKILYQELLDAQLPVTGWWWGSSESSFLHSCLISGGLNWHLFDTIDILKYETKEIVHLATAPLSELDTLYFCTEQLDIPGVTIPDYGAEELFSFGIIEGTQIGYIYGLGWFWDAENEFYNAVDSLMNYYETTGLIIDFRTNYGGNMFLSNKGLSLLFNTVDTTIGFARRSDPDDHFAMVPTGSINTYFINGDAETFYNKPIAVLTGPGAVSSGDQVALRMKFHPWSRFFGKSTATAFNGPTELDLGTGAWFCRYARYDAYLVSDPENYLTHDEFEVDVNVWHNPDDVAQGIDAVVQAAVDWIDSLVVANPEFNISFNDMKVNVYPNPFTYSTTIEYELQQPTTVEIAIYDYLGKQVAGFAPGSQGQGRYTFSWYPRKLPTGVYYCVLKTDEGMKTTKMIKMK